MRRRRRLFFVTGAGAALSLAAGLLVGAASSPIAEEGGSQVGEFRSQLPRGGRVIFPRHLVVALYGAPQDEALGALGIGSPDEAGTRLVRQARRFRGGGRRVLPAFELIASVAAADPGEDGMYRLQQPHSVIRRYLAAARRRRALLVLDVQPGRAGFMEEVRRLSRHLAEPDVGLALDPEWHVGEGEVPGQVIGSVDAETVNEVSAYLAEIARRHDTPQKLLVVHQFLEGMIERRWRLRTRPRVALTLNVDGFGDPPNKRARYAELRPPPRPGGLHAGLKLFYSEDTDMMTPREVAALRPPPELVVYE